MTRSACVDPEAQAFERGGEVPGIDRLPVGGGLAVDLP
jgi:hypothetical protein